MNNSLELVANKILPALSGEKLTYNAQRNVLLTQGYVSAAGNLYYRAIRQSKRIAVFYDIGEGYCRAFLNGITLFTWDGVTPVMIAKKNWGGCANYRFFSETDAREESIRMLTDYLAGQMKMMGKGMDAGQLSDLSRQIIDETRQNQLA